MADNIILNPGSGGATISTDDVGGVQVQDVKVTFGVDGVMTRVSASAPLPVDPSGVTSPVSLVSVPLPTDASTAANQATEIAALQAIEAGIPITNFPATQPVSASALPLPTNAAQETGGNLATIATNSAKIPALGQATAANSQPIVNASDQIGLQLVGQATQTATVNNIITAASGSAATDCSAYRSFAIQINSTGTGGGYIFEGSLDNVNFLPIPVYNGSLLQPVSTVSQITATNAKIIWVGACSFPWIRVRISTLITGGSIQAYTYFSNAPFATASSTTVQQQTAGNLNANVGTVSTLTTITQVLAAAAAADAKANPNMGAWQSIPFVFNGTTWDRNYGNWNTTTGDTGAKVASGNGATQTNFTGRSATITALLGTVSGTFTTFQFQLQYSPDAGTTWVNYGTASTNDVAPASTNTYVFLVGLGVSGTTTGGKQTTLINGVLPRTWRITWVIAGSSTSAAITAVYVNYNI